VIAMWQPQYRHVLTRRLVCSYMWLVLAAGIVV
jgi:hypothetical protein